MILKLANRRLVYNYENDSWAIFTDSLTTLGTYQAQSSRTWLSTPIPWIKCKFTWLDGVEGEQGPPGGIVDWEGEWSSSTSYVADDAVSHNGSSYVAIASSTNVEPGVTAGWETKWMVLAEASVAVMRSPCHRACRSSWC